MQNSRNNSKNNVKTILIVEDNLIISKSFETMLRANGYNVLKAKTGEAAVMLAAKEKRISLILMDINLGKGIDGIDAARQITARQDIPIVFLTSHEEKEIIDKASQIFYYGYIRKNTSDYFLLSSIEMAYKLFDAKKLLEQEKNLLRDVFEATLAGYWDWNLKDKNWYMSSTFKKMFGYEDHEIPHTIEAWQKIIFPEDFRKISLLFKKNLNRNGRKQFYLETRYNHKNGNTIWVIFAGRVTEWDDKGKPVRMVGCHIDITRKKFVEDLLAAKQTELEIHNAELLNLYKKMELSHNRYFNLYNNSPVSYITLSENGVILEANLTSAKLLHTDQEELIMQNFHGFIHREDQDNFYIFCQKLMNSNEHMVCSLKLLLPDKKQLQARIEAIAVKTANKAPVYLLVLSVIAKKTNKA